jgi:hypothetical protein
MSSSIFITFDAGEGVSLPDWKPFCDEHGLEYRGGTTYRAGQVEIELADAVHEPGSGAVVHGFTFSTFWMGEEMPGVASLAKAFWMRFGGCVSASPELRPLFTGEVTA